jgi:excisionase family DNA binding protein
VEKEFLTAEELAVIFDCHPETVMRMARANVLPAFKFGRRWFFLKSELTRYLLDKLKLKGHPCRDKEK